ncbi:MAG: NAD(P)-dependent oxidoreductase [Planctomycetota bacterium]|nr:NAD(P)-dependent oxidoreductase [Planctomycetota bacterium]MDA1249625.1 NAD(P)-dependent oxidoreductase [Planctomycetota bacterium]
MSRSLEKQISCIGLGLLGSAMTSRLIEHGWRVRGYDISPERLAEFERAGGEIAASAIAAAQDPLLLLSLPTSDIAATVLREIEAELRPGSTVVDTTTGRPEQMESFARQLAERGIAYLDATVGGSSQLARDGEAIIMCGGERTAFDQCETLFADLARETFYCGPSGSGARMKLVVNLVLGLNRAVLAEGLSFAQQLGVDGELALEVLKAGPSWSRAMDHKGERMLNGNFDPQARLGQHWKDVRLILELADQVGAAVPFSSLHENLLSRLADQGFGDLDNSAIIRAFSPRDR